MYITFGIFRGYTMRGIALCGKIKLLPFDQLQFINTVLADVLIPLLN
jgi:hypothetical protein